MSRVEVGARLHANTHVDDNHHSQDPQVEIEQRSPAERLAAFMVLRAETNIAIPYYTLYERRWLSHTLASAPSMETKRTLVLLAYRAKSKGQYILPS